MISTLTLDDLAEPAPPRGPADWNDEGVFIAPGLIPDRLIDDYGREWWDANGSDVVHGGIYRWRGWLDTRRPGGWADCTPYMRYPALRALCCYGPLAGILEGLIGEPAGVHLNLTGWVTTKRDWHQDTYLNEPEVGDWYAAVWVALGDIHPDSGPFQFIPGSHRWHRLLRDRIVGHVNMADPQWPKHTEEFLSPLVEREIERRGAEVVTYLPKRGDVLVWHSRLYHRGSKANRPGAYRPALIAHYSGIHHRSAFPPAVQDPAGGWYFPLGGPAGIEGNVR